MALVALSNTMFYPRLSGDRYINPLTDFGFKAIAIQFDVKGDRSSFISNLLSKF